MIDKQTLDQMALEAAVAMHVSLDDARAWIERAIGPRMLTPEQIQRAIEALHERRLILPEAAAADRVCVPRALLEALVDPKLHYYIDPEWGDCCYCDALYDGMPKAGQDIKDDSAGYPHEPSCPVRRLQEALQDEH